METINIFRQRIQNLVDRGVFSGCEESVDRSGKMVMRFHWLLGREFLLEFDAKRQLITAKNMLPAIKYRSPIDNALRKFIAGHELPEHRRIDHDKSTLSYTNRKQSVSLVMRVYDDHLLYGIGALLNIINEIFKQIGLCHTHYLHQQLGVPEE